MKRNKKFGYPQTQKAALSSFKDLVSSGKDTGGLGFVLLTLFVCLSVNVSVCLHQSEKKFLNHLLLIHFQMVKKNHPMIT